MMAEKTSKVEIYKVFSEIKLSSILKRLFRLTTDSTVIPTTERAIVIRAVVNIPDETICFASLRSLTVNAFTRLFRIPFPTPKSKLRNHMITESIVYQTPKIALLSKYLINAGVLSREIISAPPLIRQAKKAFFKTILLLESMFSSFSFNISFFFSIPPTHATQ